jgi:hypothetical protein
VRERSRGRWLLVGLTYLLIGIAGAVTICRVFVGSFPWKLAPHLQVTAWRTFDGFMSVTFGFVSYNRIGHAARQRGGAWTHLPKVWHSKRAQRSRL